MIHLSTNIAAQYLTGLMLSSVNFANDFVRLIFEGGWELVIYNPVTVNASRRSISLGDGNVLVGRTVVGCVTMPDEFRLQLSADVGLHVDLRDEAFVGPEAIQLIGPAGEIVVWN